ncbi:molybdate ABC transporter substrate-binding protein [Aquimarina pacifica]|uniref:molybdate ABC transporter substrate-binding protein n=1 Tax=Aquimarina pacifica TaxID=1296415 RepID=UPI000472E90B|nr:molybdate ABC transporter substrate-binding protein [Aquimarina pacifica]
MMKIKLVPFYLICITILLSCNQKHDKRLTIAVAANMQFTIQALSQAFTEQTGIACELITASSGKLTAQIKAGAPYDVFVSADMSYPTELFTSGFSNQKPKIYAYGTLVLWSMVNDIEPSVALLTNPRIQHIALANPKMAPYGNAALEILRKHDIYPLVKNKIVYGESISQTNQFIVSQSAEIGFTSKSVVLSPQMRDRGTWIDLNSDDYTPIAQGIVILKQAKNQPKDAEKFYNFMNSEVARKILRDFGYQI